MARADQIKNAGKAAAMRLIQARGCEAATLYSRSLASVESTASWTAYSLARARMVPPSRDEATRGVTTSALPVAQWHVPQASLDLAGAPAMKPGDVIKRDSDSTLWLVESVRSDLYEAWHEAQTAQYKGAVT